VSRNTEASRATCLRRRETIAPPPARYCLIKTSRSMARSSIRHALLRGQFWSTGSWGLIGMRCKYATKCEGRGWSVIWRCGISNVIPARSSDSEASRSRAVPSRGQAGAWTSMCTTGIMPFSRNHDQCDNSHVGIISTLTAATPVTASSSELRVSPSNCGSSSC